MEQLRTRFPDTLVLTFDPQGAAAQEESTYSSRLAAAADDLDVCCGFLEHVRGRGPEGTEEAASGRPSKLSGWRRRNCENPPLGN